MERHDIILVVLNVLLAITLVVWVFDAVVFVDDIQLSPDQAEARIEIVHRVVGMELSSGLSSSGIDYGRIEEPGIIVPAVGNTAGLDGGTIFNIRTTGNTEAEFCVIADKPLTCDSSGGCESTVTFGGIKGQSFDYSDSSIGPFSPGAFSLDTVNYVPASDGVEMGGVRYYAFYADVPEVLPSQGIYENTLTFVVEPAGGGLC